MEERINARPLFAAPILLAGMAGGAWIMRDQLGLDALAARIAPNVDGVSSSFIHVYRPNDDSLIFLRKANPVIGASAAREYAAGREGGNYGSRSNAGRSGGAGAAHFRLARSTGKSRDAVPGVTSGSAGSAKPRFEAVGNFVAASKFPERTGPLFRERPSVWRQSASAGGGGGGGVMQDAVRSSARGNPQSDFSGSSETAGAAGARYSMGGREAADKAKAMLGAVAGSGALAGAPQALDSAHQAAVASSKYAAKLAGDVAAKAPPEAKDEARLAVQYSGQAVAAAQAGDHNTAAALDNQALQHLQQVAAIQRALSQGSVGADQPQGGQP